MTIENRTDNLQDREPDLVVEFKKNGQEEVYVLDEWDVAGTHTSTTYSGPSIVTRTGVHGQRTIEKYVSDPNFWLWLQSLIDQRESFLEKLVELGKEDWVDEVIEERSEEYQDQLDDVTPPQEEIRELDLDQKIRLFVEDRISLGLRTLRNYIHNNVDDGPLTNEQYDEFQDLERELDDLLDQVRQLRSDVQSD